MAVLELRVVEAVHEEVHKVRDDSLGSLSLQQIDQMVVGRRQELDEDLADDADARLCDLGDRKAVKVADDRAAELLELCHPTALLVR